MLHSPAGAPWITRGQQACEPHAAFTSLAWPRAARRARPLTARVRAGAQGAAHGFFGRGRASTSRAVGGAPAAALLAGTGKAWPGGACRRGARR